MSARLGCLGEYSTHKGGGNGYRPFLQPTGTESAPTSAIFP